ncbi:general transcription factor II-I repeat domain-containing protein 2-like [Penaeus monodon]|uniref:general transcription factor II-I repeat domain-containing protein 2-like n=1 Tax=Penaeus monodon TaxID=6687 RepID=UPI0018A77963|nr:general transcription factor II-I repeat domain-containing protein 2-like [Penaeus monodon]
MTEMLNSFNLQLQGQGRLICDMYSHIKAFEVKIELLLGQVKKHSFIHLPVTQNLSAENPAVPFPAEKCVEALEMLKAEFGVRFRELHVYAKEIRLFHNPFVADIDKAQPSYQFELAELQNCDVLKDAFKPDSLTDFYAALSNGTYTNIRKHAMKMSILFGSTYICKQNFSRMKLLKTPMRSRLTDKHLHQCLTVTRMELDIQLFTSQMQFHSSHW